MPLQSFQAKDQQSGWALWFITESEEALQQHVHESIPVEITSHQKRLEWLAGRLLIKTLVEKCGLVFQGMTKDEFGKPHLIHHSHFISLSHSYPFVAAQIDQYSLVGIDIEQPKEKLLKIAHRVLSKEEVQDAGMDTVKHCVYWCGKEALYKIDGKKGLHFINQLNITPFLLEKSGKLHGIISSNSGKQKVTLGYEVHQDFVVVYTINLAL